MKLIIGLGNPGDKYIKTRHNVGFLTIDKYLKDKEVIACQSKFKAEICEFHEHGEKVFFVKPQSFMNLSGEVVAGILNFYKINPKQDLLVIHDDKDLAFGTIKMTDSSGSAGHNGVQNIFDNIGTKEFSRVRIGIESREPNSPIATDVFVLQNFSKPELDELNETLFAKTFEHIEEFVR